ncbi:type II TA system antitoxin MqsA family protein [Proteiniclasticum ruminis]|uniref:type II TA system antitoxin MqsA family protein n=1 Tax=Proteiniclasticum ruminis TaxID=398199 RepID=UPI0028AA7290|nr:type II TA system antitoxin MqsA family protein [Proteiniclasticum ruminis]
MKKEYGSRIVKTDCPICNKVHDLEIKTRETQGFIKGEVVEYEEKYFECLDTDSEENEFASASMMDENLLRARDAYRIKNGLLTSDEIAEIRKFYELTQHEFSSLLGWGEVTVTRYESKTIQDETYDHLMRMTREDPLFALESLVRHKEKFSNEKYERIRSSIISKVQDLGTQFLKKKEIQSIYVGFDSESANNGYKLLDIEKVNDVMGYFAQNTNRLYKVKLMKLLWYADVLHYKRYGKAMIGLVYQYKTHGALPLAYNEIICLPSVKVQEEMCYEDIGYKILPVEEIDLTKFTPVELDILQMLSHKFKDLRAKEIVDYMREEHAYKTTQPNQIISYDVAKELNELE